MAQDPNTPTTPRSSGAGAHEGEGQQRRKIGGKFDSVEDAVESMLGSYEKNFHETREEMSGIKQLLERAMTPIGNTGGRGRGYDDYDQGYDRGGRRADPEDEIDPTEFLSTPGRVLQRREAKLLAAIKKENEQIIAHTVGNAAAVLRFQMRNPELEEHEELVQSFMQRTNPRDPLDKRLREAGKNAQVYLAKIKGKTGENGNEDDEGDTGRSPNREEYVEGAAHSRQGGGRQRPNPDDDPDAAGGTPTKAGDQDFAEYIQERQRFKQSRFGPPSK